MEASRRCVMNIGSVEGGAGSSPVRCCTWLGCRAGAGFVSKSPAIHVRRVGITSVGCALWWWSRLVCRRCRAAPLFCLVAPVASAGTGSADVPSAPPPVWVSRHACLLACQLCCCPSNATSGGGRGRGGWRGGDSTYLQLSLTSPIRMPSIDACLILHSSSTATQW